MLIINPAHRPKRRRVAKKARRAVAKVRRRRNPVSRALALAPTRRRRRLNPIRHLRARHRRRRNPIGLGGAGSAKGLMHLLVEAAIGGVGALGVDVLWGQINPKLPASLQSSPTGVGIGDAVKLAATVALGKALSKPTKGLSTKIALGSLIVQMRDIASTIVPASMPLAGLGYFTPGRVINASARIGPNQAITRGSSPLLNRYMRPGVTPLLNSASAGQTSPFQPAMSNMTAMREGVRYR
jgi:hypothetical protein